MASSLHRVVLGILTEYDPMGLCPGAPADEYTEEAGMICLRICETTTRSATEIAGICHAVFSEMFGDLAGPLDEYRPMADQLVAAL